MTPEQFRELIRPAIETVTDYGAPGGAVDSGLESALARRLPPDGHWFETVERACHEAIREGWMCAEAADGCRFGRVIEPSPETGELGVDVVDLGDAHSPPHAHPDGEILMVMPQTTGATFDGRGRGWLVYGPGTGHRPTVRHGRALVLYLLPEGRIEWTAS